MGKWSPTQPYFPTQKTLKIADFLILRTWNRVDTFILNIKVAGLGPGLQHANMVEQFVLYLKRNVGVSFVFIIMVQASLNLFIIQPFPNFITQLVTVHQSLLSLHVITPFSFDQSALILSHSMLPVLIIFFSWIWFVHLAFVDIVWRRPVCVLFDHFLFLNTQSWLHSYATLNYTRHAVLVLDENDLYSYSIYLSKQID